LNPLGGMFEHAFNIQGIIPNNEAIVSIALEKYGASTALIMAFGMVANIVASNPVGKRRLATGPRRAAN
ncbi:PTS system ascorbate-specific transporter subunit IIC, partial [Salmonella enterica subsp. enterica serovar Heidelberg str. RI-11-013374]